jgi:hypothetical protein
VAVIAHHRDIGTQLYTVKRHRKPDTCVHHVRCQAVGDDKAQDANRLGGIVTIHSRYVVVTKPTRYTIVCTLDGHVDEIILQPTRYTIVCTLDGHVDEIILQPKFLLSPIPIRSSL